MMLLKLHNLSRAANLLHGKNSLRAVAPVVITRTAGTRHTARPTQATQEKEAVTEVVFQPMQEVKGELSTVAKTDEGVQSFARSNYHTECEQAVNEQINIEYNMSYVYHAMHAYFDRDNVGLPGFAKFMLESSDEERSHAQKLIKYQNQRGGRVQLHNIILPEMEFGVDSEKGDALYAMEMALSLEKLNFSKLRELNELAEKHGDSPLSNFVEGELLEEQAQAVKTISEYVSQLRRVGKGLGVQLFDKDMAKASPA